MGKLYWITGLSGAGKTTIGKLLYEKLKISKRNVVWLDGDNLREIFKSEDYSSHGRKKLGWQYAALCKMLCNQDIDVVICTVCMYDDIRAWNRENIEDYYEVYLKVDIDELIRRDQKGLYSGALEGKIQNVMGINMDYEEPKMPDLILDNSGTNTPEEQVMRILNYH